MAHRRSTADNENDNYQQRGHDNDEKQVLLQEVHHLVEDEVFDANESGRYVGRWRRRWGYVGGTSNGEDEFGFVPAALHGNVERGRLGEANASPESSQEQTDKAQSE